MKRQIARISILQSSKIATAMYAVLGLLYTLIGIPMVAFGGDKTRVIGIVYLCMPIVMTIIGFIFFVISAAIYNLLARWLGGFEFEVRDIP